jgi:hypothetical protein
VWLADGEVAKSDIVRSLIYRWEYTMGRTSEEEDVPAAERGSDMR